MQCQKCKREIIDSSAFCMYCGKKQLSSPAKKALKRGNGTGTVYKLSGRRTHPWVASKRKVILGYYQTKTEALDALARLSKRPVDERYNMTVADIYTLWQAEHFQGLTQKGQEMYQNAYKHLRPLQERKMRSIHAEDFQMIVDGLILAGRTHSTTNKIKQLCSQLSKWAMREDIIDKNYAQFIRLQKEGKKEKSIFTLEELERLKMNDEDDAVKLILILIYTGLRIGELLSIKKEDVFLADGYMLGGSKTEAGTNRVIPLSSKIAPYIQHFYSLASDAPLLIDGFSGNKSVRNFREREYYPTLQRLGIARKTPHTTRHTFASLMAAANVRHDLLQKIIGHADYATTANIYVHQSIDELKSAIAQL